MIPTSPRRGRGRVPKTFKANVLKKHSGKQLTPMEFAVAIGLSMAGVYLFFRSGMPKEMSQSGEARIDPDKAAQWLEQTGRIQ